MKTAENSDLVLNFRYANIPLFYARFMQSVSVHSADKTQINQPLVLFCG